MAKKQSTKIDSTKIVTTLGVIAGAEKALSRLVAVKLPYEAAHQLFLLVMAADPHVRFFKDKRDAAIMELGEKRTPTEAEIKAGKPDVTEIHPGSKNWSEYATRINELSAAPVTLACKPFPRSWLASIEISTEDLMALAPLLSEASA